MSIAIHVEHNRIKQSVACSGVVQHRVEQSRGKKEKKERGGEARRGEARGGDGYPSRAWEYARGPMPVVPCRRQHARGRAHVVARAYEHAHDSIHLHLCSALGHARTYLIGEEM